MPRKKAALPEPPAAPAAPRRAKKAVAPAAPEVATSTQATTEPLAKAAERVRDAEPAPLPPAPRRTTAELLREALAAKKAVSGVGSPRLRPDRGNAKASKDAERRFGKSRKVH